jgi:hypothetical protein
MAKVYVSGVTYLKILSHVCRYWGKNVPPSDQQSASGLLIGRYEGEEIQIRDIEPVFHEASDDTVIDEKFMQAYSDVNALKVQVESLDRVVGWYRSVFREIKFTSKEIASQIKFQKLDPKACAMMFAPATLNESFGFSIFRLIGDRNRYFNAMSDYEKIPWEIKDFEDADIDTLVRFFRDMVRNFKDGAPIIDEFTEGGEVPKGDDVGYDYIDVKPSTDFPPY